MLANDFDSRRLGRWFIAGSLLLHLGLALLLVKGLPQAARTVAVPAQQDSPLTVTILDPDAVEELELGPITNLPLPGHGLPVPSVPSIPGDRPSPREAPAARAPALDPAARPLEERLAERGLLDLFPDVAGPPATGESAPRPANPPSTAPPPGLPFVDRQELAKLFSKESTPKEPYAVNTEDLQYLSYIAKIARTLELVWKYPPEAGELRQHGVTVLRVVIREDGALEAVQLVQSSGYPLLDGEALRAIKKIAPYPPLPRSWRRSEWGLTISFSYLMQHVDVGVI